MEGRRKQRKKEEMKLKGRGKRKEKRRIERRSFFIFVISLYRSCAYITTIFDISGTFSL